MLDSHVSQLLILTQDGAGNCNTTATALSELSVSYKGTVWRGWCALHIIALVGKVSLIMAARNSAQEF
jgi:hypothetical protein